MPVAAVTIDVDSLSCYRAIHGLPAAPLDEDPIYTVALPRFFELIEHTKVPATLFCIGRDAPAHASAFEPVTRLSCEIASHSHTHDYALSRRTPSEIREDLARADAALRTLSPSGRIHGFRAPGYNTSAALLEAVVERGYYDSSLLPAPMYFAARAAAIGLYGLRGRRSSSLVGDARAFAGPLEPYRTDPATPWKPSAGPLVELPMTCGPKHRVPLFGTALTTFPRRVFDRLVDQALRAVPLFNFEMHAIDLLDAHDEGVPRELVEAQPDLRTSSAEKCFRFSKLFERLARDADVRTLVDAAQSAR